MKSITGPMMEFIAKQKEITNNSSASPAVQSSPAGQAVKNNYVSRRRARQLQSAAPLNNTTTLLGG
jgi:hypothetical protein